MLRKLRSRVLKALPAAYKWLSCAFEAARRSARSPILNGTSHQGGDATRTEGLEVRVLGGPGPIVPAGGPGVLGAILVGYLIRRGLVGYLVHGGLVRYLIHAIL